MEKGVGLSEEEVIKARELYGENRLVSHGKDTFGKAFLRSLGDPIIRILMIALGIKTIFLIHDFDWFETVGIVIAILIASFISTISEYGSEKAFEKLQEESSKVKVRVKRKKGVQEIPIEEVVVGDLVLLSYGDKIPADGYLLKGTLSVDESSINGESREKYKTSRQGILQKENELFRGSVIYQGEGLMKVTTVGSKTFYGKLALELSSKTPDSPLKERLRKLAKIISKIGYISAFFVAFSYLFSVYIISNHFDKTLIVKALSDFPTLFGNLLYSLTLAVTIIVVSVPEGLPMMVTLVLSSNMKRMLKNNVLVRRLVGIETAGSLNILFTDKTGTLTKGNMHVEKIISGSFLEYENEKALQMYPSYYETFKTSLLENTSCNYDIENKTIVGGNSTDRALLSFFDTYSLHQLKVLREQPFSSTLKYASTTVDFNHHILTFVKGAPEVILPKCRNYLKENGKIVPLQNHKKLKEILKINTKEGKRVLAIGYKEGSVFSNFVFLGLIVLEDEVRETSKAAVQEVQNAGVQVVMMTGDNKETATSIAKEVGILQKEEDLVLTSEQLFGMKDEEIKRNLDRIKVIARALPTDKSRLVRLSIEKKLVVGMTGDGVNDAPALKKADVGFAMGSGTEVAKEASDIIILDNNFQSISKAILFGRTTFKSIRKFIIFQLTMNLCAILLSILGPFIGIETPITVIQMLWVNMVMDTLAGLAFAFEPPLKEFMKEPPKKRDESILNKYMLGEIFFTGLYSAILCLCFLKFSFFHELFRKDPFDQYFLTAFFGLFIFMGIFNSFNARTSRLNLFVGIFSNPVFLIIIGLIIVVQIFLIYFGGDLFRTVGLSFHEFLKMSFLAFSVIPVDFLRKLYLRRKGRVGGV